MLANLFRLPADQTGDKQDDGDRREGALRQRRPRLVRRRGQQHDRRGHHRSDAREDQGRADTLVPQLNCPDAHAGDDRQEQVVETLVECEQLGGLRFLSGSSERGAGALAGPGQRLHRKDVDVQQRGQPGEYQCGSDHLRLLLNGGDRYSNSPGCPRPLARGGGVIPKCVHACGVATLPRGVRAIMPARTRKGSHTSSTVVASSPTATASVETPTGPPPKLRVNAVSTPRSSRSRPSSSTSYTASADLATSRVITPSARTSA